MVFRAPTPLSGDMDLEYKGREMTWRGLAGVKPRWETAQGGGLPRRGFSRKAESKEGNFVWPEPLESCGEGGGDGSSVSGGRGT